MKGVNIISILDGFHNLDQNTFQTLLNYYGLKLATKENKDGIKDYEFNHLEMLIKKLINEGDCTSIFDNYYIGYTIPQIGKEFDVLRFGENYVVNVELKQCSTHLKIQMQLEKNNYYLSFLGKQIHLYTFIAEEGKLYKLIQDNGGYALKEINFSELYTILITQRSFNLPNIDNLFDPSSYLVSPFNSTDKFILGQYFLTQQQELISKKITQQLADNKINFIAITGGAGTGKTLLTYHIAKNAIENDLRVLILHCGQLNEGHNILINRENWNVRKSKNLSNIDNYDLIIIDEAQRIYPRIFEDITQEVRNKNKKCLFSYDAKQYLSTSEMNNNISNRIENELFCIPHQLTDKIRTNKEIAYFIKQLLNNKKNIPSINYPNIELSYCQTNEATKIILTDLSNKGWKVPVYTPGIYSTLHYEAYGIENQGTAHSIVGQEFDQIVVVLDSVFKYDENGDLIASNKLYSQQKMLYQIITRTRKKLYVVVLNNPEVLKRCLDILSPTKEYTNL